MHNSAPSLTPHTHIDDPNDRLNQPKAVVLDKAEHIQKSLKQCCERFYQDLTQDSGITPLALEQWLNDNDAMLKDHLKEAMFLFNAQSRSHGLLDHHFAVLTLCLGLADLIELSRETTHQLATAALFHDIGWMKLPANLFNASDFDNPNHRNLWQKHIELATVYFAKSSIFTPEVRYLIQHHHHDIEFASHHSHSDTDCHNDINDNDSKIPEELTRALHCLQICDYYDEAQQGIGGRACLSPTAALREIFRMASEDNAFDEVIAIRFIQLMTVYPLGSMVRLSDGRIGQVVSANRQQPNKPTVFIDADWNKNTAYPENTNITLNLSKSSLKIEHEIRKTDFPSYGIVPQG